MVREACSFSILIVGLFDAQGGAQSVLKLSARYFAGFHNASLWRGCFPRFLDT